MTDKEHNVHHFLCATKNNFDVYEVINQSAVLYIVVITAAAVRVTEKRDHTVASFTLSTALVATWPQSTSCAVNITGFARGTPAEPIIWFFENPKSSGGGPVMELYYDEEEASSVVTFHDRRGEFVACFFKSLFVVLCDLAPVFCSHFLELLIAMVSVSGQSCFLFFSPLNTT